MCQDVETSLTLCYYIMELLLSLDCLDWIFNVLHTQHFDE